MVGPEWPSATCRRQRAECPRSPTRRNQTERFSITSFLQLRESDLLGLECFRSVASPSSHSSFCEEVFSLRIRETNEADRTNILAPGLWGACAAPHLLPAFTPKMVSGIGPMGSRIQLQQRNCSRLSRDFLRRSTFPSSQRTGTRTSDLRSLLQELFTSTQQIADPRVRSSR